VIDTIEREKIKTCASTVSSDSSTIDIMSSGDDVDDTNEFCSPENSEQHTNGVDENSSVSEITHGYVRYILIFFFFLVCSPIINKL